MLGPIISRFICMPAMPLSTAFTCSVRDTNFQSKAKTSTRARTYAFNLWTFSALHEVRGWIEGWCHPLFKGIALYLFLWRETVST